MLGSWFRAGYEGFDDAQDYQRFLQQRDDDPNGSDGGGEDWSEDPIEQARLMRMGIDNRHNASSLSGGGYRRRQHMGLNGLEDLGAGDEYDDEDGNFSEEDDDDDDDADCGYYDEDETNADALGAQPSKSRHFFNRSDNFENERERRVEAETAGHNFYGAPEARLLMTPQQKAMAREARRAHRMRLRAMEEANNGNYNTCTNNSSTGTSYNYVVAGGGGVSGNGGSEYSGMMGGRIEGVLGRRTSSSSAIGRPILVGHKRSSRRASSSIGGDSQVVGSMNNNYTTGTGPHSIAIHSVPKASRTSALSAFAVPTCIVSKIEQQQQQQQVPNSIPYSSNMSRPFSSSSFCPSVASVSTAMASTPLRSRAPPPPLPVPTLAGHVTLTIPPLLPPLLPGRAGSPLLVTFGGVNLAKVLGPSVAGGGAGFVPPLLNGAGGQLGRGSLFLEGQTVKVQRFIMPEDAKGGDHSTSTITIPLPRGSKGRPPPALEELQTVSHTSSRTGLLPTGRFGHCLVALGGRSALAVSNSTTNEKSSNNNKRSLLLIGGCCDTNLDHLRNSIYDAGAGSNPSFFGRPDIAGSGRQHLHHNRSGGGGGGFAHETPTAENPSIQICRAIVPRAVVSDPWLITLSARASPPSFELHTQTDVRGQYDGASSAAAASTFPSTELPKAFVHKSYSSSSPRQPMTDAEAVAELCKRANKRSLMGSYLTVNEQTAASSNDGGKGEGGLPEDSKTAAAIAGEEDSQQHDSQLSAVSSSSSLSTSTSSSLHSTVSSASSLQYLDKETGRLLQRSSPSSLVDSDFASRPSFVPPPPTSRRQRTTSASNVVEEGSDVQLVNVDYRMVHAVVGDAPTPRCFATCLEIPFEWWNGTATTTMTQHSGQSSSSSFSSSSSSSHILLLYGGTYDGKHPIGWRKTRNRSNSCSGGGAQAVATRGPIHHSGEGRVGESERGEENVFDHILPDDIVLMTEQDTDASDGGEFSPSSSRRTAASASAAGVAHHIRENDDNTHNVEEGDGLGASGPSHTETTTTAATTRSRAARIQRDRALAQDEIVLLHVDISERALICEAHTSETVSSIFAKKNGTNVSAGAGVGIIGGEKKTTGTPQSVGVVVVHDRTPAPRFGHSAVLLESTRKMCVFGGVGGLASDLIAQSSSRRSGNYGSRYTANSSGAVVVVGPRGGRSGHNAAIVSKKQPSLLGDCWLLDLMSMRWQEIILWHASPNPLTIPLRAFHSAVVLTDVSPPLTSDIDSNTNETSGATGPSLSSSSSSSSSSPSPSPVSFTREHILLIGGHLRDASGHASSSQHHQRHNHHHSIISPHNMDKRGDVSSLGVVCIAVGPSSWRPLATRLPEPLRKGQEDVEEKSSAMKEMSAAGNQSLAAEAIHLDAEEVMSLASEARLHAVACEKCNKRKINKNIKPKRGHSGTSSVYDQDHRYGLCQNNAEEEDAKRVDREARLLAIKAANTAISVGDKVSLLTSRRCLQPILDDSSNVVDKNADDNNKNIRPSSSNAKEGGTHTAHQQHTSSRTAIGSPHSNYHKKKITTISTSACASTTTAATLSVELLQRLDHDYSVRASSYKNMNQKKAEGESAHLQNEDNDNDGEPSAKEIEASRRKVAEMLDDDEAFVAEHDQDYYQTKNHSGGGVIHTTAISIDQNTRMGPTAFSRQEGGSGDNFAPEKKKKRIQFDVDEPACETGRGRGEEKMRAHASMLLGAENVCGGEETNHDGFVRPHPIDSPSNTNCNDSPSHGNNNTKNTVDGDEGEGDFDFDIPDIDELLLLEGRTAVLSTSTTADYPSQRQQRGVKEEDTVNTLTWDSVDEVLADREKEEHHDKEEIEATSSSSIVGPRRANTALQATLRYRFVDSFHGGYLQAVAVPLRGDGTPSYSHRSHGTCASPAGAANSDTVVSSSSPLSPLSFDHGGSSSTAIVLLGGDASYDLPLATVLMMPSLYSNGGAHHNSLRHIREEENYLESLHRRMSRHTNANNTNNNNNNNSSANNSVMRSTRNGGGGVLDTPQSTPIPIMALKQPSSLHMFGPKSSALLFPSLRLMIAEMLAEDDRWLLGITADLAKAVKEKCAREGWTLPLRSAASGNRSAYYSSHSLQGGSLLPSQHHLSLTTSSISNNAGPSSVRQHVYEPTDADAGMGDPSRVARYAAASRGLAYRPKKKAANALYF